MPMTSICRHLPSLALLALAGCGAGLFAAAFDPVEYGHVVDARLWVQRTATACGDPAAARPASQKALDAASAGLLYARGIPDDGSIADALGVADGLLGELVARLAGDYSPAYCLTKATEIDRALSGLQTTMGKERRP